MNKKGVSTIESVIIVPIMIISITSFILLLVTTYQYALSIMEKLDENESVYVQHVIRGVGFKREMIFSYESREWSVRKIQNIIEYLIYLASNYQLNLEKIYEQ